MNKQFLYIIYQLRQKESKKKTKRRQKRQKKKAKRRQKEGKEKAKRWQKDGKKMAKRWQKDGKKMARRWQEDGKKMARRWQEDGKKMAKRLAFERCLSRICMHYIHFFMQCPALQRGYEPKRTCARGELFVTLRAIERIHYIKRTNPLRRLWTREHRRYCRSGRI